MPDPVTREEFEQMAERVRDLEARLDRMDDYEREMRDRDA